MEKKIKKPGQWNDHYRFRAIFQLLLNILSLQAPLKCEVAFFLLNSSSIEFDRVVLIKLLVKLNKFAVGEIRMTSSAQRVSSV